VTEDEETVNELARRRTLRTLGITPDGLSVELTVSLTEEEWSDFRKQAGQAGCQPWELVRRLLGFEGGSEGSRGGLRLAHDGQREEALDR
jgi:hypothetical protein